MHFVYVFRVVTDEEGVKIILIDAFSLRLLIRDYLYERMGFRKAVVPMTGTLWQKLRKPHAHRQFLLCWGRRRSGGVLLPLRLPTGPMLSSVSGSLREALWAPFLI